MESERFGNASLEAEDDRSPEAIKENIEKMLLSCERVGEGGKAVVLKLPMRSIDQAFRPALEVLNIEDSEDDKAIKLFKLYSPYKGAMEYKMHQRAYDAVQNIPSDQRENFALVPALSSKMDLVLEDRTRNLLEERFSAHLAGNETNLIAMEYINGEDLGTIFYKWILERENAFAAEETDKMTFNQLYEEISQRLGFEVVPTEVVDDPRALELAEWKTSANNTIKLYDYLRKHHFPFPPGAVDKIENTLKLFHKSHITHGDAFERNIMVTGGMRSLRSRGSLEGEQTYIIDFGEAKDHYVEGIDEFAVVRRLKKLTRTKQDEERMALEDRFKDLEAKSALLHSRDKSWEILISKVKAAASESPERGVAMAWNRTVGIDRAWIDKFFILARDGIRSGVFSAGDIDTLVRQKTQGMTPYQKKFVEEGLTWLR